MVDERFRQVILAGCGVVDPESIDAYISAGGYSALERVLSELEPEEVISRVDEGGLLGRGGGGFPVAQKWRLAMERSAESRFLFVNAYDADPLSPIGRVLLEQMPHRVLEGLIIAAYAVGADEGIIYCRGEAREAIRRARQAITQAETRGFLGHDAFGTGRDFRLRVAPGWAGFIGGEETAAFAAVEGRRAMPTQRPPYPAERGLLGLPTVVNSAETLSLVPTLAFGPERDAYRSAISAKVFSVQGRVRSLGLIELPLGTSLREIVDLAGGMRDRGANVKAAQIGGPTGACVPASALDVPLNFDPLRQLEATLGSGRIEILDTPTCMVGFARDTMAYLRDEACGKCVPCRLGTKRTAGILEAITSGLGRAEDLEILEDLSARVSASSICGFGIAAPRVVTSTLKHFKSEYLSHVEKKTCPTGQCKPSREFAYKRRAVL